MQQQEEGQLLGRVRVYDECVVSSCRSSGVVDDAAPRPLCAATCFGGLAD